MTINTDQSYHKIATLLLILEKDIASELLKNFTRKEVVKILQTMNKISKVPEQEIEPLLFEFLSVMNTQNHSIQGGHDVTNKLIHQAFKGEYAEHLNAEITSRSYRMPALDDIIPQSLAKIIINEHPQTIALILAFCTPRKAGIVLKNLPKSLHTEILLRLSKIDNVSVELIEEINEDLKLRIDQFNTTEGPKKGGLDSIVAMLSGLSKEQSKHYLDNLYERDPDLADKIKEKMFTFEHLINIPDSDIEVILRHIKTDKLLTALVNEHENIINKFTRNMSKRAAEMFLDELDLMSQKKIKDKHSTQQEILNKIRDLASEDKLLLFEKTV